MTVEIVNAQNEFAGMGRVSRALKFKSFDFSSRKRDAGVFMLILLHPRKPHVAEGHGQHRNGQHNAEVFAKGDISFLASTLHYDDVGNGAGDGEVASKCARHGQCKPARVWISESGD